MILFPVKGHLEKWSSYLKPDLKSLDEALANYFTDIENKIYTIVFSPHLQQGLGWAEMAGRYEKKKGGGLN